MTALIAVLLAVHAAATPAKFDLVCSGTDRSTINGKDEDPKPFTVRFTVDLTRKVYCGVGCQNPLPIKSVTPVSITLDEADLDHASGHNRVNRLSGQYDFLSIIKADGYNSVTARTGTCRRDTSSGIPDRKF